MLPHHSGTPCREEVGACLLEASLREEAEMWRFAVLSPPVYPCRQTNH
jgi:hypothetical protein